MTGDFIDPALGWPLAGLAWAGALLPHVSRYLRALRADRKASR